MRKKSILKSFTFIFLFFFSVSVNADSLMMGTTTSTDNTGLLDYLMPEFTKSEGIEVYWTAVGTGRALKMSENCDVDILMVHSPSAEKKYIENGFGINRTKVMYNDFIIIGDKADPAGIKGLSVKKALSKIKDKKAFFVSRGDDSGTHKKELSLWKTAESSIPEKEKWYIQTGQGMIATLNIAAEKDGYVLTDRGTFIKYMDTLKNSDFEIMVKGDDDLKNQYSVIIVNPENCSDVKKEYALKFQNWIVSDKAQKMIKDFRLSGKKLFIPNAEK
ncbi:MAG: substrate-binding domain-containing protein [Thermodesulfobacteriota bacterium]